MKKPKPKRHLHIFCTRSPSSKGIASFSREMVKPYVKALERLPKRASSVLVGQEFYGVDLEEIPTHAQMKRRISAIQGMLKEHPNSRVVFSVQEKPFENEPPRPNYPYIVAYSVSPTGHKMVLKEIIACGDGDAHVDAGEEKGMNRATSQFYGEHIWYHRGDLASVYGMDRDLTDEVGGHQLIIRPCADMHRGGRDGHILLVPSFHLGRAIGTWGWGSHLGIVVDPAGRRGSRMFLKGHHLKDVKLTEELLRDEELTEALDKHKISISLVGPRRRSSW